MLILGKNVFAPAHFSGDVSPVYGHCGSDYIAGTPSLINPISGTKIFNAQSHIHIARIARGPLKYDEYVGGRVVAPSVSP